MAEVYHILPEVTTGKMRTPSKSQQFPAKFCAPIHRKYTIYGHPWVFLRESVFSVGRDPCVPPPGTHFSAGHAGPALRDGIPSARQRHAVIARSVATRQSVFLFWGDGFPRQCSHWLGMTGNGRTESFAPTRGYRRFLRGTSYPKGICSAARHGRTASSTIFARENGNAYASG